MAKNENLFNRLTKLFRAGPVVKRKVRVVDEPAASSATDLFKRAHSSVYNKALMSYGAVDRMARYGDFSSMESTPEISSALDIFAEETVSPDEHGRVLHIYSENRKIQEELEHLFYNVLNIEFNLVMWVRNLVKYGDFFLFNDVSPEYGVTSAFPIPISEMEREEGFDPEDPTAVRYRWATQGNKLLENWQVSHFRLLGNDSFLPYGTSVLDSARRIWRQLILIEDAMLVYRVIRAPERRVFYIDVGNVPPEDVQNYVEQATSALKRNQIVNKETGQVDLRYNPLSVDQDYFLPVRGGESGTKIDTLAGGQNTAAIEDVEYIQKKLFSALKVPKAYLGYDESLGSKATLAQEDIRFSRTIQRIQKTVISELNKLAMIHLYCHGFDGDELSGFDLRLSNPSTIAQQQKLELIRTRFEIAGSVPEGAVSRGWVQKNVLGLTNEEIEEITSSRIRDKLNDLAVEAAGTEEEEAEAGEMTTDEDLFSGDIAVGDQLLVATPTVSKDKELEDDDDDDDDDRISLSIDDEEAPIKAQNRIANAFGGTITKRRINHSGPASTHQPDFNKMVSVGKGARNQDSMNKPFGEASDPQFDESTEYLSISSAPRLSYDLLKTLDKMSSKININKTSILSESDEEL